MGDARVSVYRCVFSQLEEFGVSGLLPNAFKRVWGDE